jgi:hypothetical protein
LSFRAKQRNLIPQRHESFIAKVNSDDFQKPSCMKHTKKIPFWLRRMDRVKAEMKTVRFPRTAQEGFRQCAELSETALHWLAQSIQDCHPGATEEKIDQERRSLLARFSAAETGRVVKWKKERDRYFKE